MHIPILNDECLEEDKEAFNVSISSEIDFVTFGVDEITVYIIDDDSKSTRYNLIFSLYPEPGSQKCPSDVIYRQIGNVVVI